MFLAPIQELYSKLREQVEQYVPTKGKVAKQNLVHMMVGILLSRSVQTGCIAACVPILSKKMSIVRRLERFLDNGRVHVRAWYEQVARGVLASAGSGGSIRLIIDSTKVSFSHRLVMVAVGYQRRALPIAWTWVRHARGHADSTIQLALLSYVKSLLPEQVNVSLVGDCEFGHTPILDQLQQWHWDYVLRQSSHTLAWLDNLQDWLRLDELLTRPGDWRFVYQVYLTAANPQLTNLLLCWQRGEPQAWLLATNLTKPALILQLYHRRMWIEEMFGDLKAHGFDLEASHLQHFLRLSRLTFAVAFLYVWLVAWGAELIATRQHTAVDRADRRDLSIFRIAFDTLQRALVCGFKLFSGLIPPFDVPLLMPSGY
jgi:hypothetical protein